MRQPPINPTFPHIIHGGDYNPEQWLEVPGILEEDLRLMKLAHINEATIGVFSWASLEPEEGKFTFDWLDRVMDSLAKNGQRVVLATPSGGKPNWMALKYESIRRCDERGQRDPQGGRHNHCMTSPVYREKVTIINTKLAERYKGHPALLMWHISNEYGGYCYCPLCFQAFHSWLEKRYETPEKMTLKFWAKFWSHTYTSFDQVTLIDPSVHGLGLAWRRFMTDQVISFIQNESAPLRGLTPEIPITTNLMGFHDHYDYWKIAGTLDVVSWDSYPDWHVNDPLPGGHDWQTAMKIAFVADAYRAMKGGKPWLLMESTPSQVNWQRMSRLKRPGLHRVSSLQAIAHGSDSVMYFQFRQSRGSTEKFHGAVVTHAGHEHTRVFRDVAQLGTDLEKLDAITGTVTPAEVAIIYDWENNWAISLSALNRQDNRDYSPTCAAHYKPFWKRGVPVDVIDSTQDFSKYKLLVAPMLYMLRPGVAERIVQFVEDGGTLVTTYLTGIADEDDLCFLGGFPGPLRKLLGIWSEEIDTLNVQHVQKVIAVPGNNLNLPATSMARDFCELIHLEGATALAHYGEDFYAGYPAVTCNKSGRGNAYYIASRNDDIFNDALLGSLVDQLKIRRPLEASLPEGVSVQSRTDGENEFLFIMNFTSGAQNVELGGDVCYDMLGDKSVSGTIALQPYGVMIVRRPYR